MNKWILLALSNLTFILFSCNNGPDQQKLILGDLEYKVFDSTLVYFKPDSNFSQPDIIHVDNGRIALRRLLIPRYYRDVRVTLSVRLVSNGDPWDKAGCIFIVPPKNDIDPFNVKEKQLPDHLAGIDTFPGISASGNYQPYIELMRFMTPFGVGYFDPERPGIDSVLAGKLDGFRPVYIPKWAHDVRWEADLTHLLPLFEDSVLIGTWIDTWTEKGYYVDATLRFSEHPDDAIDKPERWVSSLVNTTSYMEQKLPGLFTENDLEMEFTVPENLSEAGLRYISTGHGGHENGDEFVQRENVILIDDHEVHRFTPWRDDCASFRRFNPTSGVWTEKTTWKGKEIEERIASSDLSRSGWCPGTMVEPVFIPLHDLQPGKHKLRIHVEGAQELNTAKNEMNFWMISAVLTGLKK